MRFRYKNQIEDVFDTNIISSIISSKRTTKEKGILEIMIERAIIKARTIDALSKLGIESNQDFKNYYLSKY